MKDNMLIKAKWKANNNSVIFDANGGEGSMDLLSIATDEKDNLPRNKFTYPGHTFLGWSTTPDGKVEYKDKAIYYMGTSKVNTLYAVFVDHLANSLTFDTSVCRRIMQKHEHFLFGIFFL